MTQFWKSPLHCQTANSEGYTKTKQLIVDLDGIVSQMPKCECRHYRETCIRPGFCHVAVCVADLLFHVLCITVTTAKKNNKHKLHTQKSVKGRMLLGHKGLAVVWLTQTATEHNTAEKKRKWKKEGTFQLGTVGFTVQNWSDKTFSAHPKTYTHIYRIYIAAHRGLRMQRIFSIRPTLQW